MLSTGLALGIVSCAGVYLIWKKLPARVRSWAHNHPLFTDAIAFVGVYWVLGGTLTALIASAFAGIFISAYLEIMNHPNDYLWIHAGMDSLKKETSGFRTWIRDINTRYKEKLENEKILEPEWTEKVA